MGCSIVEFKIWFWGIKRLYVYMLLCSWKNSCYIWKEIQKKKISVSGKKEEFKDEPVFWCLKSNNCSTKGVLITPLSGFLLLCGRSYRQEAESTVGSIRLCETIRFQWKNSLR